MAIGWRRSANSPKRVDPRIFSASGLDHREIAATVRGVNPCSSLGIGLAGFGTVGYGRWNTLQRNGELITGRTGGGVTLHIAKILVRDPAKVRTTNSEAAPEIFTADWRALV